MALSDLIVRQARTTGKDYTLTDVDGLYLVVSAKGVKPWHFRYTWVGRRARFAFGTYPELALRDAPGLRDEAQAQLAKGINSSAERQRACQAQILASEHTFMAIHEQWCDHRKLSLEEGRHPAKNCRMPLLGAGGVRPESDRDAALSSASSRAG